MSRSPLLESFDPFAIHPFTNGACLAPQTISQPSPQPQYSWSNPAEEVSYSTTRIASPTPQRPQGQSSSLLPSPNSNPAARPKKLVLNCRVPSISPSSRCRPAFQRHEHAVAVLQQGRAPELQGTSRHKVQNAATTRLMQSGSTHKAGYGDSFEKR
ncbi:hypothetical protein BT96DRAFT_992673 [Gymnopus androsaceus JB14]|uniref:Uncharacterized protein n=1 Tax=Gymnopus androsaceus JB14 TaxID=1447944 RepID=A0A6A4HRN0_9AGAR|nr:hypothetical protein BT96DRAFT_992673 [Gymnopus androsaceus JB14]